MSVSLSPTPRLETDRLILRAPIAADFPLWRTMMMSDRAQFIRAGAPEEEKIWRDFSHVVGHWVMRDYGFFVFTRKGDNTALGAAGPWYPAGWPEREIGWSVWTPEAEGQGYAFEAAQAARAYAFDSLGWDTAVSYIDPANTRSLALAERLGARPDPEARGPGAGPCVVYRHPAPKTQKKEAFR